MAEQQQAKFEWRRYTAHYLIFLLVSAVLLSAFSCGSPHCQFWLWLSPDGCGFSPFKVFHYDEQLAFFALFFFSLSALAAFLHYKKASRKSYLLLPLHALLLFSIAIPSLAFYSFYNDCDLSSLSSSISYWRGEARPFVILEYSVLTNGSATIILGNYEASGNFTLTSISLVGAVGNGINSTSVTFAPGEMKTISVDTSGKGSDLGAVYMFNVNITYTTPDGQERVFVGAKPIVGRYI